MKYALGSLVFSASLLCACSPPPVAYEVVFDGPREQRAHRVLAQDGQLTLVSIPAKEFGTGTPSFVGHGFLSLNPENGELQSETTRVLLDPGEEPSSFSLLPDGTVYGTRYLLGRSGQEYDYALFRRSSEGELEEIRVPSENTMVYWEQVIAWEGGVWVVGRRITWDDDGGQNSLFLDHYDPNLALLSSQSLHFGHRAVVDCHHQQLQTRTDGELLMGFETYEEDSDSPSTKQHFLRIRPGDEPRHVQADLPGERYGFFDASHDDLLLWGTSPPSLSGKPPLLIATDPELNVLWKRSMDISGSTYIEHIVAGPKTWMVVGCYYHSRRDEAGVWAREIDREGKTAWTYQAEAPYALSDPIAADADGMRGYLLAHKQAVEQFAALHLVAFRLQR